jgi:hypothetical protein
MTTIECTHKLNRNKGQVSKASHYQVTAEGGLFPWTASAFSQLQFRFRVPEGESYQFHGSMLLSNRIDKFFTWVSFWIRNQIADLSLFAGDGDWQRGGSPPLKRSWRAG